MREVGRKRYTSCVKVQFRSYGSDNSAKRTHVFLNIGTLGVLLWGEERFELSSASKETAISRLALPSSVKTSHRELSRNFRFVRTRFARKTGRRRRTLGTSKAEFRIIFVPSRACGCVFKYRDICVGGNRNFTMHSRIKDRFRHVRPGDFSAKSGEEEEESKSREASLPVRGAAILIISVFPVKQMRVLPDTGIPSLPFVSEGIIISRYVSTWEPAFTDLFSDFEPREFFLEEGKRGK